MRIGIDARLASSRFGGLGTYTVQIIKSLVVLGSDVITAYVPKDHIDEINLPPPSDTFRICTLSTIAAPDNFYDFRMYWEQKVLPTQLAQDPVDVFFGPTVMAPLSWHGSRVITVHDLLFERSEHYNTQQSNDYYLNWARHCAEQASGIIAVSQATADDIQQFWKITHVPVTPMHTASTLAFVPDDRAMSRAIVRHHFGIEEPYILYVGNSFPRKNIIRLLDAYRLLPISLFDAVRLVLVTPQDERVDDLLIQRDLSKRVIVTGYCEDELLPHVYASAELLVFPSLYEGFGLPSLEAMLCGTPVIASRAGAIPEVVADAAILIDPLNVRDIKFAIQRVLTDAVLRADLVRRGKMRAQSFSWDKTAKETRAVLDAACR